MSVMYIRDKTGKLVPVPTIRGAKGKDGTVAFSDLTEEQRASLRGEPGSKGDMGKSAYEYAQEGGYTGTEEEFAALLAKESAMPYTYGQEDLIAGETELETGKLHFVYE